MTQITQPSKSMVVHYPEAIKFSEMQEGVFWTANEIAVEKDIQDMRVNMTEAERHGVITTLKLFTLYELIAGKEYWGNRVMESFPRPEICRMASTFSHFELGVHAPFYNKINEVLLLNTDEFYEEYLHDDTLNSRMYEIDIMVGMDDPLLSIGCFSLVEGAILYSSFAFLKHFQTKGKNKLLNVVRGINFSVRDENIHAMAGAWLYRSLRDERLKEDPYYGEELEMAQKTIQRVAGTIYQHEAKIVDMIFEKGEIEGITAEQMKTFVKARINLCLSHLGIDHIFDVKNDIISEWFYDSINQLQFNDFFTGTGREYNRNWNQAGFVW